MLTPLRRLKAEAAHYHRSMTRQALALLEQALAAPARDAADLLPDPLKPVKPLTRRNVVAVIRKSRDSDKTSPSASFKKQCPESRCLCRNFLPGNIACGGGGNSRRSPEEAQRIPGLHPSMIQYHRRQVMGRTWVLFENL